MSSLAIIALCFGLVLLGGVAGATLLSIWWTKKMREPANARHLLASGYRSSHTHWRKRSEDDARPMCPLCGWSEGEASP